MIANNILDEVNEKPPATINENDFYESDSNSKNEEIVKEIGTKKEASKSIEISEEQEAKIRTPEISEMKNSSIVAKQVEEKVAYKEESKPLLNEYID